MSSPVPLCVLPRLLPDRTGWLHIDWPEHKHRARLKLPCSAIPELYTNKSLDQRLASSRPASTELGWEYLLQQPYMHRAIDKLDKSEVLNLRATCTALLTHLDVQWMSIKHEKYLRLSVPKIRW